MSIAKVIEVHAEGKSLEAAAEAALAETSATIDGIRSIYLQDIQAIVNGNHIEKYRVNAKVSFVVKH